MRKANGTYMHALRPAPNVILQQKYVARQNIASNQPITTPYSQVRINTGYMRLRDAQRERVPPLRLPLERVPAPDVPADVRAVRPEQDLGALGHEDLPERLSVRGGDRAREREDAVLLRAGDAER